jgi:phospho-N-acetylmuramoyl-pentapeptide-transferase
MFYHFIVPLQEQLSFLRLFQYITFRSLSAAVTSLIFVLIFGNMIINWLRSLKFKEEIRELGPDSHKVKAGTPTMGGVIVLSAIIFSMLFWGNFNSLYIILLIIATILLGALGFADDYMKAVLKMKNGMPGKVKFLIQILVAFTISLIIFLFPSNTENASQLFLPFINKAVLDLSWAWLLFATIVIVGASNAVNLTDGLDGLAIGQVMIVTVTLGLMSYLTGHFEISEYLRIPYVPAGAEMSVYIAALSGAALGFLWFNSNPATVFMGDTGSLALGGIIGLISVMLKKEVLLVIIGGVFVVETLSVIIQVLYYKMTKKRVFKMAPIHHHFEMSGWSEQKVVVRFWILGIILAIIGLSTLKIL